MGQQHQRIFLLEGNGYTVLPAAFFDLVRPAGVAYPFRQISEYGRGDMNMKWLHAVREDIKELASKSRILLRSGKFRVSGDSFYTVTAELQTDYLITVFRIAIPSKFIKKNGITFVHNQVNGCQSITFEPHSPICKCAGSALFLLALRFPYPLNSFVKKSSLASLVMNKELPYILLADDDPDDLNIFLQAFSEIDPHAPVHTVTDGQELFEFLGGRDPCELPLLIVLDYKMPIVSGPEVLQRLASVPEYAHIPKVIWSTSESPKTKITAYGWGPPAIS